MKFDHIGVTTTGLLAGRALLGDALGVTRWTEAFDDPVNDIWVQFGTDASGTCYELLAPRSERSPINRVLSKKINVLNHVAYLVDDLAARAERLVRVGFAAVAPAKPAIAYGNRPIQFFVSRSRLLVEMIEAPGHQHRYTQTYEGQNDQTGTA